MLKITITAPPYTATIIFVNLYALSQPNGLNTGRYSSISEVVIEGAKETETQVVNRHLNRLIPTSDSHSKCFSCRFLRRIGKTTSLVKLNHPNW
jgi:hypothetical protein